MITVLIHNLILLVVAAAPASSLDDSSVLHEAEASFEAGVSARNQPDEARKHFQKAANAYKLLYERGICNPVLLRNQGNACLLANDLPGAILAYRRGLRLEPNDFSLHRDLAYAREQVAHPRSSAFASPPIEHWPPWLLRLPLRSGLFLAVALYSLGWLGLARWFMTRFRPLLTWSIILFTGASLLSLVLSLESWYDHRESRHPLVVIAYDGVLLRKGNGLAYPRRYETPLHRGVEATMLAARGDWVQIELSGGEVGWVPRSYLLFDAS